MLKSWWEFCLILKFKYQQSNQLLKSFKANHSEVRGVPQRNSTGDSINTAASKTSLVWVGDEILTISCLSNTAKFALSIKNALNCEKQKDSQWNFWEDCKNSSYFGWTFTRPINKYDKILKI